MRETSQGDGVGRIVPGRQDQRDPIATHLLSAVQTLPALLPAVAGSLPRQTARLARERRQTGLAPHPRTPHQFTFVRETLNELKK